MVQNSDNDDFYLHDFVYGEVRLPSILKCIIDTIQFQRLRRIKQLGLCSMVYINATHSRFEHCIGTAFLTSKLVKLIRNTLGVDVITHEEELCLTIAGLCHDLGHGPFSHFFERVLESGWTHESMSLDILDCLLGSNPNVKCKFIENKLTEWHVNLIKSMILGRVVGIENIPIISIKNAQYSKKFLLQIVCNNDHGIDTDKLDYLRRDSLVLGLQCSLDIDRLISNMSICFKGTDLILCFNYKLMLDCQEVFHWRWKMQKNVYRHKTVVSIEILLKKLFLLCEDFLELKKIALDPNRFVYLTDEVLGSIVYSTSENHEKAMKILQDIDCRKIYKHGGRFLISEVVNERLSSIGVKGFLSELNDIFIGKSGGDKLKIKMEIVEFGFQKGSDANPLEKIYFYTKTDKKPFRIDASKTSPLIPKFGSETYLDIFYQPGDGCHLSESMILTIIKNWWKVAPD